MACLGDAFFLLFFANSFILHNGSSRSHRVCVCMFFLFASHFPLDELQRYTVTESQVNDGCSKLGQLSQVHLARDEMQDIMRCPVNRECTSSSSCTLNRSEIFLPESKRRRKGEPSRGVLAKTQSPSHLYWSRRRRLRSCCFFSCASIIYHHKVHPVLKSEDKDYA